MDELGQEMLTLTVEVGFGHKIGWRAGGAFSGFPLEGLETDCTNRA